MALDSSPLYARIADELRQNIDQGVYRIGDRLPTEMQLAARYAVNRHTVRQAIALLKQEGLLRVDQGRGTFVAAQTIRYPIGKRVRYGETLKAQGLDVQMQVLRMVEVPADAAVAEGLAVNLGESVALVERLARVDEEPISIGSSHFPLRHFPDFLQQCHQLRSISQFFQNTYGCDHLRRSTRVSARLVKPQDARLLELSLNQPILLVESVNVDQQGRVIEYGVTRFRGDRMELMFENRTED
jgi:GntR family phosphonate transport system transcriptional regulator